MALDSVSSFFRKKFGLTTNTRITSTGIKVWMPVFVQEIDRNTNLLEMKARRLEEAAERIEEKRKKEDDKKKVNKLYTSSLGYFT